MSTLLHISASPRGEASESLNLARVFLDTYRTAHPDAVIESLDLWQEPLPVFDGHTAAWAVEYGARGVNVNAIGPGPVRTEGTRAMGSALDELARGAPAGRPASPEEIAATVVYLASDEARDINGAILMVDGGMLAG